VERAPIVLTEPLLTPAEAAALLQVRPSWVYEAARGGRLPHMKLGKHIRFARADLDTFLAAQRVPERP
jgi:excisionase family DNA binding protein